MNLFKGIKRSFRKKIIFFYIVLVALPLVLLSGIFISKVTATIYNNKKELALKSCIETARTINDYILNIESLSELIELNEYIQKITNEEYDPYRFAFKDDEAATFNRLFGYDTFQRNKLVKIHIDNASEETIFSVGELQKKQYLNTKEFLQGEKDTMWTPMYKTEYYTRADRTNILSYYNIIVDSHKFKKIGVLRIDIGRDVLESKLLNNSFSENSILFIVDKTSDRIIASNVLAFNDRKYSKISMQNNDNSDIRMIKGEEYLCIEKKLKMNDVYLVANIWTDEFNVTINQLKKFIGIVLVIMTLFIIVLSLLFSNVVTKPIYMLVGKMKQVEEGDLKTYINIKEDDDLTVLSRSFNSMIRQINTLIERNYKIKIEKEISDSLYLQSQLDPHFLYNTLDSIRWMARKNKDYDVSSQIEALSNMFRHSFNNGQIFTTFKEEVKHLNDYMKLQKVKYDEKIHISITIDPDIEDTYTLNLLLQPIVENSIKHGLDKKLDKGHIEVNIIKENNYVRISVSDDGIGVNEERIRQMINTDKYPKKALLLKNLNRRIKLYYGEEYELEFYSEIGVGTRVEVTLPLITEIPDWGNDVKITDC